MQQKIPATYGSLTATPEGTLFECDTDDLALMARYLMMVNLPFAIHEPPELRDALLRLAEQMAQFAKAPVSRNDSGNTKDAQSIGTVE